MELNVKLESFEGPLDLLLHLIDKNKVNIYDIPISLITEQYLEYLSEMKRHDLNIMSEFLVMATTLLDIKAKMLLPAEVTEEGEEIDPRQDLVQQLIEYKMYKYMSYELRDRQLDAAKNFYKDKTLPKEVEEFKVPVDLSELVGDMNLMKLQEIFKSIMKRQVERIDPVRAKFGKIEKEEVSMEEEMEKMEAYVRTHKHFSFREILAGSHSKLKMIVVFLTILEFMKMGKITITQEDIFDDIIIESCLE
ncbi:MAG: segregation/condensation protein A [Lachnospiraceae bacterium]|jgi:segregation and condensation protein A|nr:segregation/condensation protein A [Lachnospiraceae bacterium]